MNPTDGEKVIEFLRDIAEQLGPAGQHAFQIVYTRVMGEAIIWGTVGSIALVAGVIMFVAATIYAARNSSAGDGTLAVWILGIALVVAGFAAAVPSFINLLSPEYATIERILNLVGNAR